MTISLRLLMNDSYPIIEPLDPSISRLLETAKHITTFLSIFSAIITAYIVIGATKISNREYSILQLTVVFLVLLNDIDAQLIFDPFFLLPLPCVTRSNPLIPIPGSAKWHYIIWVGIVTQQAPAFIACFIHRHQVVLPPNSPWRISRITTNILLAFYCIIILTPIFFLKKAMLPHDIVNDFAQFISHDWPSDLMERMDCTTYDLLQPFAVSSSILHITSVSIVVTLIIHTFRQLNKLYILSSKKREFQKRMTLVLILQTIFPVLVQVIPNLAGFSVFIMGWKGSAVWPVVMLVLSTNSFAHSSVLIGTTPIYRRAVVLRMKRIFSITEAKPSTTVASTAHRSHTDL